MIKVEKFEMPTGATRFAFECNAKDDHEVLDKLRVALLSGAPIEGGVINSNRFVIETRVPAKTL